MQWMDEWLNIFSSDQKNQILMAIMAGYMVGIIYNENIISSLDDKEGVVSYCGACSLSGTLDIAFLNYQQCFEDY